MPWLMDETENALEKKFLARALLDCKRGGANVSNSVNNLSFTPPTSNHS